MTRLVGFLQGPDGPLDGRLYLKPSSPFIGAPANGTSFKIENGVVDIEVPANTASTVWLAGWRGKFEQQEVEYSERWLVPNAEQVSLDDVRGYDGNARSRMRGQKTDGLDLAVWKQEAQAAKDKLANIEHEKARLLLKVSSAEGKAAAAAGQVASLNAEIVRLKQKLIEAASPTVKTEERIIERKVLPEEAKQELALAVQRATLLQQEVDRLQMELTERLSLATHFTSLHEEIDRLAKENQVLQLRINELKQPVRNTSALRREAIENLDRLLDG